MQRIHKLLVDKHGLAEALDCSVRHIDNLAAQGRIPVIKVGKLNRYNLTAILAALEAASQSKLLTK